MKILFLNPHEIYHKDYDYFRIGNNLGIAFLTAVCRKIGHEVEFIDCAAEGLNEQEEIAPRLFKVGLSDKALIERIEKIQPDLICISCQRTPQHYSLERIVKLIRGLDTKIPIAVGGTHVTGLYEQILNELGVDYVIRGEGERAIATLLRYLEGRVKKKDIPGLAYKQDGFIRINDIDHLWNLNEMPDPAYDIFQKELYANARFHTACVRGSYLIDYVFSRGCPNNCSFCMATKVHGPVNRTFSLDRIRGQFREIKVLGYDEILLEDDDVFINKDISLRVFEELNKLGFHWSILNGVNSAKLTPDFVEAIASFGCDRIYYPVESINFSIIEPHKTFWRKFRAKLNNTPHFIRMLIEAGVETFGGFMIGFPGETREQIHKTIEYARFLREECGLGVALFFCVTPYPGTQLYRDALASGRLYNPEQWELYTFERGNMHNGVLSADEITDLRDYGMLKANGRILYDEIFSNNHRPDIRTFYRNHPECKWSKYFTKERKAVRRITHAEKEESKTSVQTNKHHYFKEAKEVIRYESLPDGLHDSSEELAKSVIYNE